MKTRAKYGLIVGKHFFWGVCHLYYEEIGMIVNSSCSDRKVDVGMVEMGGQFARIILSFNLCFQSSWITEWEYSALVGGNFTVYKMLLWADIGERDCG